MKILLPKDEVLRCREAIYVAMRRPGIEGQEVYKSLLDFVGEPTSQILLGRTRGGVLLSSLLNFSIVARWAQLPLAITAIVLAVLSDPHYWWGLAACVFLWMNLNALQVRVNVEIAARLAAYGLTDTEHAPGESPARYVPLVSGLVCVGIALGLVIWFSGWWRYIPAAILLGLGLQHFAIGLFATDKAIKELTNKGTLSEETMLQLTMKQLLKR